jgi:hypothetical protein
MINKRCINNTAFISIIKIMFSWFKSKSTKKVGFEDVLYAINNPTRFIILNTLVPELQNCLIKGTLRYEIEEQTINDCLNHSSKLYPTLIIYGKNSTDATVDSKEKQLEELGFEDVYVYSGGMFEWLLLQDTYGLSEFPTTGRASDILKYRTPGALHRPRIAN